MAQFDVYPNPMEGRRIAFPFVAVLQSDTANTGRDRVVAFMAPRTSLTSAAGRLTPFVDALGRDFVLMIPWMANVRVTDLELAVASIVRHRDRIVAALDLLFLGV